jgi:hypothetical protein
MAALRHIALNPLRLERTYLRGVKARQKQAGWDNDYLNQVLVGYDALALGSEVR